MEEEIKSHLLYYCTYLQDIWDQVQACFIDCLYFSQFTPRAAIFGFCNIDNDTFCRLCCISCTYRKEKKSLEKKVSP